MERLPLRVLGLGAFGLLSAQEPLESDSEVLKTMQALLATEVDVSSARSLNLFDTPSTVSFVDRDFLMRYGVRTLAEAVELVAGLSVVRSGLRTDLATSRGVLQENYANRVLLLIDGVGTWMALSGDPVLSRVDIHDVERIEILKGPASVLYGSNAYAGAINVVLRRAGRTEAEVRGDLSSAGGHALGGSQSLQRGDAKGLFTFSATRDVGNTQAFLGEDAVPFTLADFRENRNLNLSLATLGHSLLFNTFETRYPHLGNAIRRSGGGGKTWVETGYLFKYGYQGRLGEHLTWNASAVQDQGRRAFDSSLDGSLAYRIQVYRRNVGLGLAGERGADFDWQVGLQQELRKSLYDQAYDPRTGQTLNDSGLLNRGVGEFSAFAQTTLSARAWSLFLGTRYTKNDNFGSNVASRATLLYRLAPRQSLKLIWGQSYRSPTLLEQYLVLPGVLIGNPAVGPETSDSVEVEYLVARGAWYFQGQAYWMKLKDKLIRSRRYPVFSGDPTDITVTYINGATFETAGLEAEIKYQPSPAFDAFLNLNYIHGTTGDALPNLRGSNYAFVPMGFLKAGVSRSWGPCTASLIGLFQTRASGPLAPLPSWASMGLHLGFAQRFDPARLHHALDVKRLGDRERRFPENARRNLNAIPEGLGRDVAYTLTLRF